MSKHPICSFRSLKVYQLAFTYSVEVYTLVQQVPQDSDLALAQKLLARSQAVRRHIADAWGQRRDLTALVESLSAAQLEVTEVQMLIEAAIGVGHLNADIGQDLCDRYRYLSAVLDQLMATTSSGAKRMEKRQGSFLPATA